MSENLRGFFWLTVVCVHLLSLKTSCRQRRRTASTSWVPRFLTRLDFWDDSIYAASIYAASIYRVPRVSGYLDFWSNSIYSASTSWMPRFPCTASISGVPRLSGWLDLCRLDICCLDLSSASTFWLHLDFLDTSTFEATRLTLPRLSLYRKRRSPYV